MRRTVIFVFALLLTATAFAGETQRYFVGTRGPAIDLGSIGRLYRDTESQAQPRGIVAFRNVNAFAADLTTDEVAALKKSPGVTYVEPVVELRAFADPYRNFSGQTVPYGVDLVKARQTWVAGRGAGTNVVVIDTGVDYNHPDLKPIYAGGLNTYDNAAGPMDDAGHGSHVAGTIGAIDDDNGVVGIAPNVKLWAIKILNSEGTGSNDRLVTALDWTINKKKELGGNWVVNLSLGHSGISVTERTAVTKALDAGILIVAASGNDSETGNVKPVSYPAAYDGVLTVGAVDSSLSIASFSNQGASMDLVAPGVGVLSSTAIGFGSKAYVQNTGRYFLSYPVTGSAQGTITGQYVDCGKGNPNEIPASVRGKIALIQRSNSDDTNRITFAEKGRNAKEAGAVAVVIYDAERPASAGISWTFRNTDLAWSATYEFPLGVSMTLEDGLMLKQQANKTITVAADKDDYAVYNGTSMATPHVAGAAALVWSLAPSATPEQVRNALTTTAKDLGTSGQDPVFGFGMLDVFAAAKLLAPNSFGSPAQPGADHPTTGRPIGRRR